DVDLAVALEELADHRADRFRLRQVAGQRERLDALPREMLARLVELVGLSRGQRELRAHLAERLGDLQPQAARAAGDEGDFSAEIEELLDAHGSGDCRLTRIFSQSNLRRATPEEREACAAR